MKKSLFTGLAAVALASAAALAPATVFADATNAQGTTSAEFKVTAGDNTAPDDKGDNGTGDNADLWLVKAPDLHFAEAKVANIIAGNTELAYAAVDKAEYAKLTGDKAENQDGRVEISDLRGSGAGWTLSASITDFTNTTTGSTLNGTLTLGLTASSDPTLMSNSATASGLEASTALVTNSNKPVVIWTATGATKNADGKVTKEGTGQGTSVATVNPDTTKLTINSNPTVNAGTYDATITWTLGSAPTSAK